MKDRVPINPGRVLITPENGNAAFYATMTRADNPTQEGDPLNKNTLLKDATAALYGLGADAVPDDVLRALKSILDGHATDIAAGAKIATGSYIGTGTYGASNPCSLTFDFVPQIIVFLGSYNEAKSTTFVSYYNIDEIQALATNYLTTTYKNGLGFRPKNSGQTYSYAKISADAKTVYWYNTQDASYQFNGKSNNYKYSYDFLAIG